MAAAHNSKLLSLCFLENEKQKQFDVGMSFGGSVGVSIVAIVLLDHLLRTYSISQVFIPKAPELKIIRNHLINFQWSRAICW